jgi:hypothetical protein
MHCAFQTSENPCYTGDTSHFSEGMVTAQQQPCRHAREATIGPNSARDRTCAPPGACSGGPRSLRRRWRVGSATCAADTRPQQRPVGARVRHVDRVHRTGGAAASNAAAREVVTPVLMEAAMQEAVAVEARVGR